jgi:PAS domain-containing protein
VCVLVGEVLARQVARLEQSRSAAVRRGEHEQAVVDALADGVLVVGEDGRVLSCNDAATALLGVPRSALVGAPPPLELGAPGDLLHHTVGARWLETVASAIDGTGEHVVVLRDVSRHRALDEAKDLFLATDEPRAAHAVDGDQGLRPRAAAPLGRPRRGTAPGRAGDRRRAHGRARRAHRAPAAGRPGRRVEALDRHPAVRPLGGLAPAVHAYDGLSGRHRLEVDLPDEPLRAVGDPAGLAHVVGPARRERREVQPGRRHRARQRPRPTATGRSSRSPTRASASPTATASTCSPRSRRPERPTP